MRHYKLIGRPCPDNRPLLYWDQTIDSIKLDEFGFRNSLGTPYAENHSERILVAEERWQELQTLERENSPIWLDQPLGSPFRGIVKPQMKDHHQHVITHTSTAFVDKEKLHLVALTMIDKVGPKTSRALLQHFGGAEAIFRTSRQKLMTIPSVGEKIARAIHGSSILQAAERELKFAEKNGIEIVTWYDNGYPRKLKEVDDSPLVLYVKGKLPTVEKPHIAVVGTRRPSANGRKIATEFASYFAQRGIVVVSGLAYGIDYEAHAATLDADGCTIAVLGHGLDQVYPKEHAPKAKEIVEKGGALVTEFCSNTKPDAYNFPSRNRIISGLCDSVLVVEATEKGGALITAKTAFDQDREVFAVPGSLGLATSVGCNRLIRDQIAKIACEPADVLDGLQHLLHFSVDRSHAIGKKIAAQLSDREEAVCQALVNGPTDLDTVGVESGIFGADLQSILLGLEFRHVVIRVPGNKYQLAG